MHPPGAGPRAAPRRQPCRRLLSRTGVQRSPVDRRVGRGARRRSAIDRLLEDASDAWDLQHFRTAQALLLALRGKVAEAAALAAWAEESQSRLGAAGVACGLPDHPRRGQAGPGRARRGAPPARGVRRDRPPHARRPRLRDSPASRGARRVAAGEPRLAERLVADIHGSRAWDRASSRRPRHCWPNTAATRVGGGGLRRRRRLVAQPRRALRAGPGAPRPGALLAALGRSVEAQTALAAAATLLATLGAEPALGEVETLLETLAD